MLFLGLLNVVTCFWDSVWRYYGLFRGSRFLRDYESSIFRNFCLSFEANRRNFCVFQIELSLPSDFFVSFRGLPSFKQEKWAHGIMCLLLQYCINVRNHLHISKQPPHVLFSSEWGFLILNALLFIWVLIQSILMLSRMHSGTETCHFVP